MKKLLLHIGYPKTATTTLQQGLFNKLHEKKIINYLGKYRRWRRYKGKYKFDPGKILTEKILFNNNLNNVDISFSSKRLNILSNEVFSSPKYNLKMRNKRCYNPFSFPKDIKNEIGDKVDDLKILVILRAQQSLIYSLYIQSYKLYKNDENLNTFDKYLSYILNSKNQNLFATFYFYDTLKKYSDYFGKEKIHILLFEDYCNDKKLFLEKLSKIINVDTQTIKKLLENKHFRKRTKTERGTIRKISNLNNFGKFVHLINYYNLIPSPLKIICRKNNLSKEIFKKISNKNQEFLIPKITQKQKETIFRTFRKNNLSLMQEFDLDEKKLKKYGYI